MILSCSYCLLVGKKRNLCDILADGSIKILRMQTTKLDETNEIIERSIESTIIHTKEFTITCGDCNNVVFIQQPVVLLPQVNIMNTWGTMVQYYETKTSSIG